jgi:hypothetical protein
MMPRPEALRFLSGIILVSADGARLIVTWQARA